MSSKVIKQEGRKLAKIKIMAYVLYFESIISVVLICLKDKNRILIAFIIKFWVIEASIPLS